MLRPLLGVLMPPPPSWYVVVVVAAALLTIVAVAVIVDVTAGDIALPTVELTPDLFAAHLFVCRQVHARCHDVRVLQGPRGTACPLPSISTHAHFSSRLDVFGLPV